MQVYDEDAEKRHDSTEPLDPRDARALTEKMTVLAKGGDVFDVISESGATYTVDIRESRCTCPDAQYNLPTDDGRERCKHVARVQFATGRRTIPAWCDTDAVDPLLGQQVSGTPRVTATDGGATPIAGDDPHLSTDEDGEDGADCECAALPDGVPCADCFISGDAQFN